MPAKLTPLPNPYPRRSVILLLASLVISPWLGAARAEPAPLPLHVERMSATDLAVKGRVDGVPVGETRYVRWADLAALPSTKLKLTGEFVPGEQEVCVIYLTDLWRALPRSAEADTLLATCKDGYAAVYRASFMEEYKPFLILSINGLGPEQWPPPGLTFNPGPYVISISEGVIAAVAHLIDAGHKRPWGVTTLDVAAYSERFAGIERGPWATLSTRASEGREIWVHSCASCHAGPKATFGGTKSGRMFDVLVAQAVHNPDYFKGYVRAPKTMAPLATMEAHPHYTDTQLEALIGFLSAEKLR